MLSIVMFACKGQEAENKSSNETEKKEENVKPQTSVVVNKEYDEDGNLVRYDSTYTYYYSNIEGDEKLADSLFNEFKTYFHSKYPFSYKPFFNDLFFEDSLLQYDFYKNDFFEERFKLNMERMEKLFQEMDSIKNEFFFKQFKNNEGKDKQDKN